MTLKELLKPLKMIYRSIKSKLRRGKLCLIDRGQFPPFFIAIIKVVAVTMTATTFN
jgi:hypothetical protein